MSCPVHIQHREELQAQVGVLPRGDAWEAGGAEGVPSVLCVQFGEEDKTEARGGLTEWYQAASAGDAQEHRSRVHRTHQNKGCPLLTT